MVARGALIFKHPIIDDLFVSAHKHIASESICGGEGGLYIVNLEVIKTVISIVKRVDITNSIDFLAVPLFNCTVSLRKTHIKQIKQIGIINDRADLVAVHICLKLNRCIFDLNRRINRIRRNLNGICRNIDRIRGNIDWISRNIDRFSRNIDRFSRNINRIRGNINGFGWSNCGFPGSYGRIRYGFLRVVVACDHSNHQY